MKAREMILVALFAALTAIGAFIRVPLPIIPFTLQVFFCAMAALCLGARLGMMSQAVYVGMGLLGLPVFVEGGGLGYFFKPTFGYLLGFILGAYVIGRMVTSIKTVTVGRLFAAVLPGLATIYLCGLSHMYLIYHFYLGMDRGILWVLYWGFAVCVPGDLISCYLLALIGRRLLPILRARGYVPEG